MKWTLIDSVAAPGDTEFLDEVSARAPDIVAYHPLRQERFAPCRGCWGCWVKSPGACVAKDASSSVMRDILAADALLFRVNVRFGCWDPIAKAALDKCIGLISPFFSVVEGETHHKPRYDRYPRWAVLATVGNDTNEEEKSRFRTLVQRNALNLHSDDPWVGFSESRTDTALLTTALASADEIRSAIHPTLDAFPHEHAAAGPRPRRDRPRRVLLWVGSAKPTGQSTSESLGSHLLHQLETRGWSTETVYSARATRLGRGRSSRLREAASRADLILLAAPVYVDCLPALVLAGLRELVDLDLAGEVPPAVLPIVQSGFPELQHTALALGIVSQAVDEAGLRWAGHLALGGGGNIDGQPLSALGGRVARQVRALNEAAESLDAGEPVTPQTTELFAQMTLPAALYRLAGNAGWLAKAWQNGALRSMWDRPFEPSDDAKSG